jgi:hypothetical protein
MWEIFWDTVTISANLVPLVPFSANPVGLLFANILSPLIVTTNDRIPLLVSYPVDSKSIGTKVCTNTPGTDMLYTHVQILVYKSVENNTWWQ